MGQNISLIITKNIEIKVPHEIPHLIRNGLLIIALAKDEFSYFVVKVLKSCKTNLSDYIEGNSFVRLVRKIELDTFLAYHESDWGLLADEIYFAVVDGEIIIESIESFKIEESGDPFISIPEEKMDPRDILEIDWSNMDYYHSYYDFKKIYNQENNLI
ncbi:hypothetical protein L0669_23620 [Flavobacterium bizetiae]|uniref:hypothetical protein n=1 Tax=Flavobacterium bizetiae TaxID=2704140 RepID=UPI0021E802A1|nr:hypothetical protein [Flavobacterium bizetiae]UTN04300.1 hypothetical protein L0669_23620 [Flavobacterium bizetiae]